MLSKVDHTLLKPEANLAPDTGPSAMGPSPQPLRVGLHQHLLRQQAVEYMAGRVPVCCVVRFPPRHYGHQKQGI